MIESGFALLVAFFINVAVISVSGAVCNSPDLNKEDQMSCSDLDLNEASFLLRVCLIYQLLPFPCCLPHGIWFLIRSFLYFFQNVLGKWSSKLFAIALLASGQSSTITGTYAGQYVMQVLCWSSFHVKALLLYSLNSCSRRSL